MLRVSVAVVVATVLLTGCVSAKKPEGAVGAGGGGSTDATAKTATWGERYTWPDGLAVEVSVPVACQPSKSAAPQGIVRAVKVTVKVINGTKENFETGVFSFGTDAQHAGKSAETVVDFGGGCGEGMDSATVLPGKTFESELAFSVAMEPGELQIVLQPNIMAAKGIFVGQA